ncbi:MAG: inorganic phosphate transporter, partial [Bacteroidales bacterium]|nr:inorganic phosphate transporter [Bacteroidales bacterium]
IMETTYLIFVILLFILAISDLVVGVSNDAVNFLNSAIGSKVARHTVIMIVAAAGVFVGSTFSSGMMEVARKGIFNPQFFSFSEVMIIYMAVMLTDIILLDGFNRLGFPTSTTVSIVFEILGGAIAMAVIKISNNPDALSLGEYINSSKALAIISGILLSVVISFTVGALIQWLVRYVFSFNFDAKIKYFGAIYGGLAITAITYFMLIKGIKGTPFAGNVIVEAGETVKGVLLEKDLILKQWVQVYALEIVGALFLAWTVLTQILVWLFKINILKIIVLVGTFALAFAFAGNDLVNFIGVPIAALHSFKMFIAGGLDSSMVMEGLSGKVETNGWLLAIAGVVMILTLWFSKKARRVIETGIDLSRQSDGDERFGSSGLARSVVRGAYNMSASFNKVIPQALQNNISKRFDSSDYTAKIKKMENPPAFDMVRASVNLIVASILISFATSLKLPLSTTYVTFMVAMGTSLADRAWGRESAVFRITGVFTVIGGWFLTALIALTVSFIFANVINLGGLTAVIILFIVAMNGLFRKKKPVEDLDIEEVDDATLDEVEHYKRKIRKNVEKMRVIYLDTTKALMDEDHRALNKLSTKSIDLCEGAKVLKNEMYKSAKDMEDNMLESGLFHVQTLDYLRGAAHSVEYITSICFKHVANNHKPLTEDQKQNLINVSSMNNEFLLKVIDMINARNFEDFNTVKSLEMQTLKLIKSSTKSQVKAMKENELSTRASMLYLNYLQETKNVLVQTLNLVKFQRDADKAALR